ncbi:MAG: hypothetical protein LBR43_02705 [Spiroplasmataceae bacterium]|jgi:hypothetical protein|nr:hypothetical protein [Spiroplasmataceae bacterium]
MAKKEKKLFYFLYISHLYCLISGWFNGGDKMTFLGSYFWHFLAWWCTWNSLITIFFVLWKSKNPKSNSYFAQIFSLIVMISNLITMLIYGLGLVIWLSTALGNQLGVVKRVVKLVPIPSHKLGEMEIGKVIQWWLYSPVWHFIAPTYFIVWFFRNQSLKLLKKNLKLTILFSLIQPTLYFFYGYLRSKLGDKNYFKSFNARWVLPFLSSKKMSLKLGLDNDYRFVWKIILALFWFSFFGLITCLTLRYREKIKVYLLGKKKSLVNKSNKIFSFRLGNQVNNKKTANDQ